MSKQETSPEVSVAWKLATVHNALKRAGIASQCREVVFDLSVSEDKLPDISILKQARKRVAAIKAGTA